MVGCLENNVVSVTRRNLFTIHFINSVPTALNGVSPAGGVDVNPQVCSSVTKCTGIYDEQTAGPRSANLCTRLHTAKVRSSVNFHLNSQRPWPSFARSDSNRVHWEVHMRNGDRQDKRCYCQHKSSHVAFRLVNLHLTLGHSKGHRQGYTHIDC